jgi:hypothetical protein
VYAKTDVSLVEEKDEVERPGKERRAALALFFREAFNSETDPAECWGWK